MAGTLVEWWKGLPGELQADIEAAGPGAGPPLHAAGAGDGRQAGEPERTG